MKMKKIFAFFLIINAIAILAQEKALRTFPDMESKLDVHFPIEKFRDKNGKPYPANYLEGKTSLINFWFSACAPCIQEIPVLNKVQEALPDSNFIGITYDNAEKVKAFISRHQYKFAQITDAEKELKEYLTVQRYPMSLIIGRDGKVKEVIGVVTEEKIPTILEKMKN
ncbi:TlpA family protein disulfide reductase [Chryseobacterium arthrosphaerae]|nr:TlpA family protein disulfide reductase [Chryseobacterium arthrosphaerae]